MTCGEAVELIAALLDGELGVSDTLRLQHHLGDCKACRAAQESEMWLHSLLAAGAIYAVGTKTGTFQRIKGWMNEMRGQMDQMAARGTEKATDAGYKVGDVVEHTGRKIQKTGERVEQAGDQMEQTAKQTGTTA